MGPVNWLAVVIAVLAALAVSAAWYGPLFGRARLEVVGPGGLGIRRSPGRTTAITAALLLVSATMMGHMFARVGADTLAVKWWLYFMMSGGLAIAFVIPSLWISYTQQRISTRLALIDGGFWLSAYLSMGLAFFLLG
ncbi:DUF1761 domain-containing protein [Novosphingobium sp. MMS21-SN21R]|uniref:DUF1761 domain-containing protein n=1 Tax=Novosphingobium sp. MMS21-SN21R TaxID=2969298 RepID=UPI002887CD98|nr:DUF1761 domain-containing protein [Novosphingobium sp. MMS21-SN21R]MDT0507151.1 DUF1761 domain-containing protein [Novosphingobium sp. MMS21-SN21R]